MVLKRVFCSLPLLLLFCAQQPDPLPWEKLHGSWHTDPRRIFKSFRCAYHNIDTLKYSNAKMSLQFINNDYYKSIYLYNDSGFIYTLHEEGNCSIQETWFGNAQYLEFCYSSVYLINSNNDTVAKQFTPCRAGSPQCTTGCYSVSAYIDNQNRLIMYEGDSLGAVYLKE